MDMDAMEELSGSNDQNMIIKGKRTKRQRPLSPAGRAATSCSSSGGGGGEGGGGGGGESGCSDGDLYNSLLPSSTTSSEISTSTEEEEDMAKCLILLAQGGCSIKQEEEEIKIEKFNRRRFNEIVTNTTAKAGFYVYECKTCNRTFPSFQALGGHRASHKKPRPTVEEKKAIAATSDDHEEEEDGGRFSRPSDPPQSMEQPHKALHGNNKSKSHECSICGSEFSSGQALGGHMRRHRNPTSTKPIIDTTSVESEKPRSIFLLDLNLPAPEDDHRDLKFQFAANQQHLVFSAPALVDCHY